MAGYKSKEELDRLLVEAVEENEVEAFSQLLDEGADINARDVKDAKFEKTVLMIACCIGNKSIVDKLLEKGVDIDVTNTAGTTALMYAAWHGHTDITERLIQANCNVNHQNHKWGQTALHRAASKGFYKVVSLLLKHKAEASILNKENQTALQVAEKQFADGQVEPKRRDDFYRVVDLLKGYEHEEKAQSDLPDCKSGNVGPEMTRPIPHPVAESDSLGSEGSSRQSGDVEYVGGLRTGRAKRFSSAYSLRSQAKRRRPEESECDQASASRASADIDSSTQQASNVQVFGATTVVIGDASQVQANTYTCSGESNESSAPEAQATNEQIEKKESNKSLVLEAQVTDEQIEKKESNKGLVLEAQVTDEQIEKKELNKSLVLEAQVTDEQIETIANVKLCSRHWYEIGVALKVGLDFLKTLKRKKKKKQKKKKKRASDNRCCLMKVFDKWRNKNVDTKLSHVINACETSELRGAALKALGIDF